MPPHQDASGRGGGGASAAASPTKLAPSQLAKGKGKATGDDLPDEDLAQQQLLARCVLQAEDADPVIQGRAILALRRHIRTATGSATDILKPLKFLCPHYENLKALFETMPEPALKSVMAGILSVLALTMSSEGNRESLKYCMMGSVRDICPWGHVYVRNLACEITDEVQKDDGTSTPTESIIGQVLEIVKFNMKHHTEPEALDLLMEVGYLEAVSGERSTEYLTMLLHLIGLTNFKRACLYLTNCSRYLAPDNLVALSVVYFIYMKFGDLANALRIGLLLEDNMGDSSYVKNVFAATEDFSLKQQFAYMIARYGSSMMSDGEMATNGNEKSALQKILCNTKLTEGYLTVARDIEVMEPKSPEDIYKVHLIRRDSKISTLDSGRQNLAATFVNAFVNAGFCQDALMTGPSDSSENCLFKNQELGKTSATASLGLIYLWDPDSGLAQLNKYLSSNDTYVVSGALLGIGIVCSGVKNDCDTALGLISDYISKGVSIERIGAILGLGIAYAGSREDKLKALLSHILSDPERLLDELVFSAISLALVFVGSCDEDITQSITHVLSSCSEEDFSKPIARMLPVALGLLYLGKQERATTIVEVSLTLDKEIKNYCSVTIMSLAYAGTGRVNMVQKLLHMCSHKSGTHRGPAVFGIALIAMAEEIGSEMAVRSLKHLLQYGDLAIRRAVPLSLAMLFISNPKVYIVDTLSLLSRDSDIFVSLAAIISLGFIGAGTNNSRVARLLRDLSNEPDDNHVFSVRIAQALLHLGKGLLTLDPCHSDKLLLSPVAVAGLVTVLHACLNMPSTILGDYPYMLYILVLAMQPRMLLTVDEDLKPLPVPVRVGQAVDVAGQAGQPRTISGFRTLNTPVVLAAGERAELANHKYIPLAPVLEGFVILRKNPDYYED